MEVSGEKSGEGGWEMEDLEIPTDVMAEATSSAAAGDAAAFVAPTLGVSAVHRWQTKCSLAAEQVAAGTFDTAMRLLTRCAAGCCCHLGVLRWQAAGARWLRRRKAASGPLHRLHAAPSLIVSIICNLAGKSASSILSPSNPTSSKFSRARRWAGGMLPKQIAL